MSDDTEQKSPFEKGLADMADEQFAKAADMVDAERTRRGGQTGDEIDFLEFASMSDQDQAVHKRKWQRDVDRKLASMTPAEAVAWKKRGGR